MLEAEFSTTAMNRPELVNTTYESFCSKLTDVDFDNAILYLNVDPVPTDTDPMDVVDVAKKHFGNVVYRIPEEANFPAAVQWCWSKVKGKHVFHLEDDWILTREILFKDMIKCMNQGYKGEKLVQVFLRRTHSVHHNKICLSPSLLDGDFVRARSKMFNILMNPEAQLRGVGVSTNFTPDITVQDIGREWLRASRYRRPKGKGAKRAFVKWLDRD